MNKTEATKYYKKLQSLVSNLFDSPSIGGNISVKYDDKMLIKSSGSNLKNETKISIMNNETDMNLNKIKPSMEYSFHKIIPYKFVLHYHPIYLMPYLCSNHKFDLPFKFKILDYHMPGVELAGAILNNSKYNIYLLKNHGIILCHNDIEQIEEMYRYIKEKFISILKFNDYISPDDVILNNDIEVILYHWAIRGLSNNIIYLNDNDVNDLNSNSDEKYRKNLI